MKSEKKKVSLSNALKTAIQFISQPFQAGKQQPKQQRRLRKYTVAKRTEDELEFETEVDRLADRIGEFDRKIKDIEKQNTESGQDIPENQVQDGPEAEAEPETEETESKELPYNSFHSNSYDSITDIFCSGSEALCKFDDFEMIQEIHEKFPNMAAKDLADAQMRLEMLNVINDSRFMKQFLAKYDIDVFYFFRLMYRFYSHLFNATFVKKIQKNLKYKKYMPPRRKNGRRRSMKIRKNKKYDF